MGAWRLAVLYTLVAQPISNSAMPVVRSSDEPSAILSTMACTLGVAGSRRTPSILRRRDGDGQRGAAADGVIATHSSTGAVTSAWPTATLSAPSVARNS